MIGDSRLPAIFSASIGANSTEAEKPRRTVAFRCPGGEIKSHSVTIVCRVLQPVFNDAGFGRIAGAERGPRLVAIKAAPYYSGHDG
jgi:hypothetical protein